LNVSLPPSLVSMTPASRVSPQDRPRPQTRGPEPAAASGVGFRAGGDASRVRVRSAPGFGKTCQNLQPGAAVFGGIVLGPLESRRRRESNGWRLCFYPALSGLGWTGPDRLPRASPWAIHIGPLGLIPPLAGRTCKARRGGVSSAPPSGRSAARGPVRSRKSKF